MNTLDVHNLTSAVLHGMKFADLNETLRGLLGEDAKAARSREDAISRILAARRADARAQPASDGTIRAFAETQLKTTSARYSEVLARVKDQFPECNTSRSSLRWYASQMRRRGETLPDRPLDMP